MDDMTKKDLQHIWHPYTQMQDMPAPIGISSAKEEFLYTHDGRTIIDAISSWWVNTHGHCHPEITEAVSKQAKTLDQVIFAGFSHQPASELAHKLSEILPQGLERIFYSDNGSTAVEVALKMAFQYWSNQGIPKTKILALDGAYHGDTFGSMSVSGRSAFNAQFEPFMFDVEFIPFPEKGKEQSSLHHLESCLKTGAFAGIILEPLIQGAAGMRMYSVETLENICKLAKENDVLVIADEVMTGFGRTGETFAFDHTVYSPDIMCLSKGLTGGFIALGVTACNNRIYNAFLSSQKNKQLKTLFHGHSFTANPIACVAALASIELQKKPCTEEGLERINRFHIGFKQALGKFECVKNIRIQGTVLAFEITTNEEGSYFHSIRDEAYNYFLDNDCLIRPLGNTIYLLPPYCISIKSLEKCKRVIMAFLGGLK